MATKRKRLLIGLAALCVLGGAAALLVTQLLGGNGRGEALVITEGQRASQVYEDADEVLNVPKGSTEKAVQKAAKRGELKLPEAADGDPEGFLYPATYPVDDKTTPKSLVSRMVSTAKERFARYGDDSYDTVKIASIVQGEADNPEDMGKVARVIQNRIQQGQLLQMDSTINYALGRSTLNTTHADTRLDSPYNTYRHKGLPPTPINNPGEEALKAAADPPKGDWLFFVTVKPGDTRFTSSYKQHMKWVDEFNKNQRGSGSGS
ncbi:endolytic transglycosylase MltG [Streptomyces sp. ODS28]|uniref:endolytic transglycosylase MltG n=1 Tax=Streptomyces sp. ODS28 TaxID=3136688 RepID=UPI0031E62AEC